MYGARGMEVIAHLLSVPLASGHQAGPPGWVVITMFTAEVQAAQCSLSHGFSSRQAAFEAATIELAHPVACSLVVDRPEADDDGLGSCDLEGAEDSDHAFAGPDRSQ